MCCKNFKTYASINQQGPTSRAQTNDIIGASLFAGYPEVTRPFSPVFRGLHILNRDEEGRENCTACGLCAVACPAEAITMEAAERVEGEEKLYKEEKYAAKYEINMLRCIFCGLCEEACPKDAIYLSETFAPANFQRKGFIYGKEDLLIPHPITEPEAHAKAKGGRVPIK